MKGLNIMTDKIVISPIRYPNTDSYYFRWGYYQNGILHHTEDKAYPVEYKGSIVPMGFVCSNCGSSVITDWRFYYGPLLHPTEGEWVGKCLQCGNEFSYEYMKNPTHKYIPSPKPSRKPKPKNQLSNYATTISYNQYSGMQEVIYHSTVIVAWNTSKIVLNSDNWKTSTTKRKMNQCSNQFDLRFRVYQEDFIWYVSWKGEILPFHDGMVLER